MGDFNPSAAAFRTQAKNRMTANVRSDLAGWVRQLQDAPDQVLRVGDIVDKKELMTSKELFVYYDAEGRSKKTANGLGRELSSAGIRQAYDGRTIKLKDGSCHRYYVIRNQEYWVCNDNHDTLTEYLNDFAKKKGRKY
jgi:hypothetical protein